MYMPAVYHHPSLLPLLILDFSTSNNNFKIKNIYRQIVSLISHLTMHEKQP